METGTHGSVGEVRVHPPSTLTKAVSVETARKVTSETNLEVHCCEISWQYVS